MALSDVLVKIGADISGLRSGLDNAQKHLRKSGGVFAGFGNQLSNVMSLAVAGFGAAAVQAQADFGKSMAQIRVLSGAGADSMKQLETTAQQMSVNGVHSVTEISGAMLELTKSGMTPAQIQAGALAGALTLASAGGVQLGDAASIAANSIAQFSLKASDMPAIADAFAGAANASTASVETLAEALRQVGPTAQQMGLSLNESLGVLALFDQNALKGSDAGTSLKTMLMRLVPSTDEAAAMMSKLGLKFTDAQGAILPITNVAEQLKQKLGGLSQASQQQALSTIFGNDAIRGATILMNAGSKELQTYIDQTMKAGSAQELAGANTEGTAGALLKLQNSFTLIAQQIGAAIEPAVTALASGVQTLAGWFTALDDGTQVLITSLGMAVVAVGPLMSTFSMLSGGVSMLVSGIGTGIKVFGSFASTVISMGPKIGTAFTIMTGPVGAIVAAVAALGGIAAYVYKNWEAFKAKFTNMWETIKVKALSSVNSIIEGLNKILPDNMQMSKYQLTAATFVDQPSFQSFGEFMGSLKNDITGLFSSVTAGGEAATKAVQKVNSALGGGKPAMAAELGGGAVGGGQNIDLSKPKKQSAADSREAAEAQMQLYEANVDAVDSYIELSFKQAEYASGLTQLTPKILAVESATLPLRASTGELFSQLESGKLTIDEFSAKMQELNTLAIQPVTASIDAVPAKLTAMQEILQGMKPAVDNLSQGFANIGSAVSSFGESNAKALYESAKAIDDLKAKGQDASEAMRRHNELAASSLEGIGKAALASARQTVAAFIQEGVAAVVRGTLISAGLSGPLAIPVAMAAGGLASAGFNSLIASLKIPAFAEGGVITGPTLGLMGEYPGARNNPEFVGKLSDIENYIGGRNSVAVMDIAISGQDLLLTQRRAQRANNRMF